MLRRRWHGMLWALIDGMLLLHHCCHDCLTLSLAAAATTASRTGT